MTLPLAEQSPEALREASEVWEAVQELIKPSLSDGSYRMWFADVEARAIDGTALELAAPSDYVRNWLVTHHMDLLTDSIALVGQHGIYCRSERFMGQPKMDIALVLEQLDDAKQLLQSALGELERARGN